jgi:hypothetical protein
LQYATVTDAIWTKATLNKAEHATLSEDCVRHHEQHDNKSHSNGYKLEDYIYRSVHENFKLPKTRI